MKDLTPHPAWVQQQLELVASRRRFSVSIREAPEADEDEIERLEDAIREGSPHPVIADAFSRFRPLLDLPVTCEILGDPKSRKYGRSKYVTDKQIASWTKNYLKAAGRNRWSVDLDAAGIRDDRTFWWWVIRGPVEALFWLPSKKLDLGVHLAKAFNPGERYNARMSPKAAKRARDGTKKGDVVCIAPGVFMASVELAVIGGQKQIERLYREALEVIPFDQDFLTGSGGAIRPADDLNIIGPLSSLKFEGDWDSWLAERLRRGAKRPQDREAVDEAVIAGEVIATFEGRGGGTGFGLNEENLAELMEMAAKHPPLAVETVRLAHETVEKLATTARFVDPKLVGDPWMTAWREMATELAKRLRKAASSRTARAKAPNAAPPVIPERAAEDLIPTEHRELKFYGSFDDLAAVFDAFDSSGAQLLLLDAHGEHQRIESARTFSELAHDVEREVTDLQRASCRVWWPSVTAAPTWVLRVYERYVWDDAADEPIKRTIEARVPGWGMGELVVRGQSGKYEQLAESVLYYPSDRGLSPARRALRGPWQDVDWRALDARIKELRAALLEAGGGRRTDDSLRLPVLPDAAALFDAGWVPGDRFGNPRRLRKR